MKIIRICMLGSGFVANFYMEGLRNVNGQEVVLNFSHPDDTVNRAEEFAKNSSSWALMRRAVSRA